MSPRSIGLRAIAFSTRRSSCVVRRRRSPGETSPAAGRRRSRGLCVPRSGAGRRPGRRPAVRAVRGRQGLAGDLQLHVPARPRRPDSGSRGRKNGAPAAGRAPLPLVHRVARSARRCRRPRRSAGQPRGRGKDLTGPTPGLLGGTRLAAATPPVVSRQYVQPRLPGRDGRRPPTADADGLPPRRADDPSLLELGALLRAGRAWAGPAARRHPRAALEPARPHSRGTSGRVVRAFRY